MKSVFICGDSFCCPDPNYPGFSWVERLQKQLPEVEITTLASPGATNFLIAAQIEKAITADPDFIIVTTTGTLRFETNTDCYIKGPQRAIFEKKLFEVTANCNDLSIENFYQYFHNRTQPLSSEKFRCYSLAGIKSLAEDNPAKYQLLNRFEHNWFAEIEFVKSILLIEGALLKIKASKIPLLVQLENMTFNLWPKLKTCKWIDADEISSIKFDSFKWADDLADPVFHIERSEDHQTIADYYAEKISKTLSIG